MKLKGRERRKMADQRFHLSSKLLQNSSEKESSRGFALSSRSKCDSSGWFWISLGVACLHSVSADECSNRVTWTGDGNMASTALKFLTGQRRSFLEELHFGCNIVWFTQGWSFENFTIDSEKSEELLWSDEEEFSDVAKVIIGEDEEELMGEHASGELVFWFELIEDGDSPEDKSESEWERI